MEHEIAQQHISVLAQEILAWLQPDNKRLYVDATLGLGGHTAAILGAAYPDGRVVGFEWDEEAAALADERLAVFGKRVKIVHSSYADLVVELDRLGIAAVDGIIADLGVSSLQLDQRERGFSFMADADLDMRMDRRKSRSAADLIASLAEEQLADIFYHYGEERQARPIARAVVRAREVEKVESTGRLVEIVSAAIPKKYHPKKIHVATKVFQALRIAVNSELDNLLTLLSDAPQALVSGGRLCIITFHSLEDRMVKQAFNRNPELKVLTRRPVIASEEEVQANPRARSAKLRVAAKV